MNMFKRTPFGSTLRKESLASPKAMEFRHILQDCLKHSPVIREIYRIAGEAIEKREKEFLGTFE